MQCRWLKLWKYVQQIEQLKDFVNHRTNASNFSESVNVDSSSDIHFQNKSHRIKTKFCDSTHPIRKCPAFGKTCSNCGKVNHFAKVCRSKTSRCSKTLEAYDGHTMHSLGKFTAIVEKDDNYVPAYITVIDSKKNFSLLGRDLLENRNGTNQVHSTQTSDAALFLPVIKGVTAKMDLVDGARDVFCRAHSLPVALESRIAKELDHLESMGIIIPIQGGVANASPVVWINTPNECARISRLMSMEKLSLKPIQLQTLKCCSQS